MTTMRPLRLLPIGLGAILALAAAADPEPIHACRDANGVVVYQEAPCAEAPKPRAVVPKPPVGTTPAKPDPRPVLAKATPRPPERGSDPRYATPERTWQTFVEALQAGDRAAALACLTPDARDRLDPNLESLKAIVRTITRIETEGTAGPFWSLRGLRPKARPKWILLERSEGGNWKIAVI